MGAAAHLDITGAKGGESKPKTPVEAPDSLQSTNIAKLLLAVGEGEFDGTPTDRDIYLDNTPIVDASGNVNFPGVKWEWRNGSVEQEYIQGIPAVENETTVNVELRSDNPFARALSNTQLSAVRVRMSWARLAQQDSSSGNTNGYRIEYAIDIATDGGAYVEAHLGAVDGKTTNGYQRSVRVDLPKATSGWMMRVRRITPNANQGTIADTMTIAGYTEIIDEKLRYPNTALLYIEFDAEQFQNIPAVTVDCNAKRWPVPSNYDPRSRTYTGAWDGTFKQAWTNNPAFATYGVCVEDRFGLGKRIKPWMVDKWEMYRIAQYCDQMVPNGVGGQEPRYLCDLNLQGRAEAWTLLRDLSAIYRGMVYWAHGSLFTQADMPRAQDIDYVFTRANVIDGEFVYGGAERSTHYSRALVSYDNPANNYDTDVIPVTDLALQRRYRDRPIEISAIGCTRASEAQRRGKWALLSNNQDRTVTFKTGLEGRIPLPGYVIPVADELVAGRPNGGRISAAAGRVVTLDRDTPIKAGDRLILNLPNGTAQARTVQSVSGRDVTVTTDYGVQPEPELQWAIDYDDLAVQLFRVLKTTRTQEGQYEITALEFNPSKFAAIDTGAKLDERPISVIPITTVQPPESVTLSSTHMIDQGIAVSTMTIAWPAVQGAVSYDVEWRKDNGNWIRMQRTGATSVDVTGIYAGAYLARVRAVSAFDITSVWKSSILTQLTGKEGLPPAVTSLTTESLLFGIGIKWTFPPGAEDTQRTELWYSEGTDLAAATKLADLAYPQSEHIMQGLRGGQRFFFWARLVDRSGNVGPWFPADGTVISGMASMDPSPILEQITGEITESELGQDLTSKIEKIELIDGNGPGSVNERIEQTKAALAEQVVEVNNALTEVQTELQGQIDQIADLADSMPYVPTDTYAIGQAVLGEDGKLYQASKAVPVNTPPPNTAYWTDIGQAVQTAVGTAARVTAVETKVTEQAGELTAQSKRIDGVQSSLTGKADASTVTSIGNRVTEAEGKLTSQGQAITGVQNSLTATNSNVTAAQQAAQAASDLAGSKGRVIVQSGAPAVADRLAQNLWIDTTGNANTPKRWNGSAWAAVTDKVATDAAAAAASALTQVATKADASTVQALTNTVEQHGTAITADGKAITSINASLSQAGGENLFYNPSFERVGATAGLADGWTTGTPSGVTRTASIVASTLDPSGKAQRFDVTGIDNSVRYLDTYHSPTFPSVSAGQMVSVSIYVKVTAGCQIRWYLQPRNAAGATIATLTPGNTVATGGWQRLVFEGREMPAGTVSCPVIFRVFGASSIPQDAVVEIDRAQFEIGQVATGWRDNGQLSVADIAANASATTAITGRVTAVEGGLTSASGQITELNNSIGDVGGENLLYNPTFNQAAAGSDIADGWAMEGPASSIDTLVSSWLNSGEKAVRTEVSSVGTGTPYRSLRPSGGSPDRRPRAAAGQTVTGSIYLRGTPGLGFRFFFQWVNEAGTVVNGTTNSAMLGITAAGKREQFTAVVPPDGVKCYLYFRVYSATGTTTAGYVEMARPQMEYGAKATGWKDNGQVNAANNSATSAAVDGLTSTVGQQGSSISSVANRTTSLENAVNSTTNGLATKASAASVTSIGNRVTANETGLSSQSSQITQLKNSISGAMPFVAGMAWEFTGSTRGWAAQSAVSTFVAGPLFGTIKGPANFQCNFTPSLAGAENPYLRIRLRRRNTGRSGAQMYWANEDGGLAEARRMAWAIDITTTDWQDIEFDLSGHAGWNGKSIYAIRLDMFTVSADVNGEIDIAYIAVGRRSAAASAQALSSMDSKVTQQGAALTAETLRIDGLYTSVGTTNAAVQTETKARSDADGALSTRITTAQARADGAHTAVQSEITARANADTAMGQRVDGVQASLGSTNAAVQQVQTAQANLNNHVSATWSVKLGLTSGGNYYAAGFGLGLENAGGTFQSSFVVMANRFAVMNPIGEGLITPFAIQNGQVFINDALISNLAVQKAIVGQSVNSSELANDGTPIMRMDFSNGTIIMLNKTATAYTVFNRSGIDMVINGVRRIRMGEW